MIYYDTYIAPVKVANKQAYIKQAQSMNVMFKEYGAVEIADFVGTEIPKGEFTSFGLALKLEDDECVIFGYVSWASKQKRDEAWQKIRADKRMQSMEMLFDGKRLIHGGFEKLPTVI